MTEITGLKKPSISGYLPYSKVIYKPEMISVNAARIKAYRERKDIVDKLQKEVNNDLFLECNNCIPELSVLYIFRFTFFLYCKGRKK